MSPPPIPAFEEHEPIIWPVQSFTVDQDFKSPHPAHLILDRANSEFGLIYQIAPRVAIMAQFPDNDEPVFFQVSRTRAACSREGQTCKKVCVLVQHLQIDLEFATADNASDFMHMLGRLATKVGNLEFEVYEAQSLSALNRPDFNIEKMFIEENDAPQSWSSVRNADTFDWAAIYKSGKCIDFTVVAEGRSFPVHRILLCTRSQYFNAVCDGRFAETEQKSIALPESAETISLLLQELYGVYNPATGSIFTSFAMQRELEKEAVMNNLLALFIAFDKYTLEPLKRKAAEAVIDRLPFLQDALGIIGIATVVYDDSCPQLDCGLRKAVIAQIQARLPTIMEDEIAWEAYSGNRTILKALHAAHCATLESPSSEGTLTPPPTPQKVDKKFRPQTRSNGV